MEHHERTAQRIRTKIQSLKEQFPMMLLAETEVFITDFALKRVPKDYNKTVLVSNHPRILASREKKARVGFYNATTLFNGNIGLKLLKHINKFDLQRAAAVPATVQIVPAQVQVAPAVPALQATFNSSMPKSVFSFGPSFPGFSFPPKPLPEEQVEPARASNPVPRAVIDHSDWQNLLACVDIQKVDIQVLARISSFVKPK